MFIFLLISRVFFSSLLYSFASRGDVACPRLTVAPPVRVFLFFLFRASSEAQGATITEKHPFVITAIIILRLILLHLKLSLSCCRVRIHYDYCEAFISLAFNSHHTGTLLCKYSCTIHSLQLFSSFIWLFSSRSKLLLDKSCTFSVTGCIATFLNSASVCPLFMKTFP